MLMVTLLGGGMPRDALRLEACLYGSDELD
jgi:hypothetical protein